VIMLGTLAFLRPRKSPREGGERVLLGAVRSSRREEAREAVDHDRWAAMDEPRASQSHVFDRIVCGTDGTPASLDAVRQAIRLQGSPGNLHLVTVANLDKAAHAGMAATHAADILQSEAETALAQARAIAPAATSKLVDGEPVAALLSEAESEDATLVAVGSHGHRRAAGLVLGTVTARMLRDATCSVLIARPARSSDAWPQSIVVGVDGSAESAVAFSVARSLAERFGGSARAVASTRDHLDREAAQEISPDLEEQPGHAVEVLAAASKSADLVVVGSRGLHGLKALGSVSERIAHEAHSSVLVVRDDGRPPHDSSARET
jgi:nucleotide-binding universal stress UspA family protein